MATLSGTFRLPVAITPRMRGEVQPSDGDLMRQALAGEREAFAALYRRHQDAVYRFARLMTGSDTLAEDVVQDVFVVLIRDGARWEPARASFSTYVYGMARHMTRRRMARERRFIAFDDIVAGWAEPATQADVSQDLVRRSELARLRRVIVKLPSRYREVVVLCDVHGLSYAEAAGALACAIGTVRSRLHRGRELLAERMYRSDACRPEPITTPLRCEA